jgi:hypothetical protein
MPPKQILALCKQKGPALLGSYGATLF